VPLREVIPASVLNLASFPSYLLFGSVPIAAALSLFCRASQHGARGACLACPACRGARTGSLVIATSGTDGTAGATGNLEGKARAVICPGVDQVGAPQPINRLVKLHAFEQRTAMERTRPACSRGTRVAPQASSNPEEELARAKVPRQASGCLLLVSIEEAKS